MRRDDPDVLRVDESVTLPLDLPAPPAEVVRVLAPLVTEARLARMHEVIAHRTRAIIPVLDGLCDPHNMSAVLRSADAFGLLEVHAIESDTQLAVASRVARGAEKWLDIVQHTRTEPCLDQLHARGYEVFFAAMDGEYCPEELRDRPRIALVFGNEHRGPSDDLRRQADGSFAIPMVGFVESLNVSVAAATTLYTVRGGRPGDLDPSARETLLARYLFRSVRDAERIVLETGRG